MTTEKASEKPTIGEAAGLVPAAKLAEVEDARLKEANAAAQLREDLEAKTKEVSDLKENIIELAREKATLVKARDYAESECVKAKGEEAGHKREEARLGEANRALSQEVDQLRRKGSDLWESLTTSNKVRDEAVKRSDALQVEMDEAQVQHQDDIKAIAEFLKPILEPLTMMLADATNTIMEALASPEVQAEVERLLRLKEADEGFGVRNCKEESGVLSADASLAFQEAPADPITKAQAAMDELPPSDGRCGSNGPLAEEPGNKIDLNKVKIVDMTEADKSMMPDMGFRKPNDL